MLPDSFEAASGLDNHTVTGCQQLCVVQGANYSAYHDGSGCFCGDALPSRVSSRDMCNVPCTGDSSQICGGVGYSSVYSTAGVLAITFSCSDDGVQYELLTCQVQSVLNSKSDPDKLSYEWDFGDSSTGSVDGVNSVDHIFGVSGDFTVTVTVSVNSQTARAETTVQVIGEPMVALTLPPAISSELRDFSEVTTALLRQGSHVDAEWSVDRTAVSTVRVDGQFFDSVGEKLV